MIEFYEWFMSLSNLEMAFLLIAQLAITLGLKELTSNLA